MGQQHLVFRTTAYTVSWPLCPACGPQTTCPQSAEYEYLHTRATGGTA